MVHGQADDLLGDPVRHGQVLGPRGVEPPVGRERADERVEVPASEDVVVLQLPVEVVAGHAVLLSVHEDREVGVVVPHARHVLEVGDALDIPQALAVELCYMPPCGDRPVDLPEIQQAYRRAYLVHLAVDARGHDRGLVREAEVLEVVDALLGLLVVHDERTALHGVVHLGGVEAQRGHVARVEYRFPVNLDAEGVRRVVYHLESVLVRDLLDALDVAGLAVAVYRHDGRGLRRDCRLYFVGIHAAVGRVDVHEHWLDAVPPYRVRGRDEAERGRDDLPGYPERLKRRDERQGAVGEEADIRNLEISAEGLLQFPVVVSVVSDPLAGPDVPEVFIQFVKVRQERRRHCYLFVFHIVFPMLSVPGRVRGRYSSVRGIPPARAVRRGLW